MDLEFSRQIFEKCTDIKFHENSPVVSESFHVVGRKDGRTDGHDEANSRFSQFCEGA